MTKNSQRGFIEVLNAQDFRTMGKIEICIFEYLKTLGAEACRDKTFITDLREEIIDYFERNYETHIAAWRNKKDKLVLYVKSKEKKTEILS